MYLSINMDFSFKFFYQLPYNDLRDKSYVPYFLPGPFTTLNLITTSHKNANIRQYNIF